MRGIDAIGIPEGMTLERGAICDWLALSRYHGRSASVGAVDRVYRVVSDGRPAAVVVYAFPYPQHPVRNLVFEKRYCGGLTARERRILLNRELRVVRRVVVAPALRGRGLASAMLRATLPLLDVPCVECITALAGAGFLLRAGFVFLGRTRAGAPFYYLRDNRRR